MTSRIVLALAIGVISSAGSALAQPGMVNSFQKISETQGGFGGNLDAADLFGHGVASLGDIDGDGITDVAVGAFGDDDGGFNTGAVWILFLNTDGTVKAEQKISDTEGGFGGELSTNAIFGVSLDGIGDLDGDGVPDLAVGNYGDDDGGLDRGAIWIVFLNPDGTVKTEQKISDTRGGFNGTLSNSDLFGSAVANVGDLDNDGVTDLAVGAWMDDDGGSNRGAIWILFLSFDGTVKWEQKISDTQGGFGGTLDNGDQFGTSVAGIGDLDGDGVTDLAVGAYGDDDGGPDRGAVWILFMNSDGTVKAEQKVSDTTGGFAGVLGDTDMFGCGVAGIGDLDSDGTLDLTVAALYDDDGGTDRGGLWVLFMNSDGTVQAEQKISDTEGGFTGGLDNSDRFGTAVGGMGDWNGDGGIALVVGATGDYDGNANAGAVWVLFLDGVPAQPDIHFVNANACPGPGSGTKTDPFCSIQDAIDAAFDGDSVHVAPGIYYEMIDFLGKAITVRSYLPHVPSVVADTIIDAQGNGTVVTCDSGEGLDTVLNGLTITGGGLVLHGGGMLIGGSPTVTNCVIRDNGVVSPVFYNGGGMSVSGSPTITNCVFLRNVADRRGGAMEIGGSPTITNCVFRDNAFLSPMEFGAGMLIGGDNVTLTNCTFTGNSAPGFGGGIAHLAGNLTVTNCLFSGNDAWGGGGILADAAFGETTVTNCTFSANSGGGFGGSFGISTVTNCIFWDNTPEQIVASGGTTVSFSDVQGGFAGTGNIDADPMLIAPSDCCRAAPFFEPGCNDPTCETAVCDASPWCCSDWWDSSCVALTAVLCSICPNDYGLQPGSPCIDAGNNTAVPPDTSDLDGDGDTTEPTPSDLDGDWRFRADPATPDCPQAPGQCGDPPVVDMGALEFQPCWPADLNGDGLVDAADLTVLLGAWAAGTAAGDIDGDGDTDSADLTLLLGAWVVGCP